MKVAVASMGTLPEAWVGIQTGLCSQFLVFDLKTMEYVVVSVPPNPEQPERVSLAALRAIVAQDVAAVITGRIREACRETLQTLGVEVIDGVEGMTVQDAIRLYKATGLRTPAERQGPANRVAIAAHDGGLEAPLERHFGVCTSFIVVDPQTMQWTMVEVEPDGPAREVSLNAVRAVVRSGANVLITPHIHPTCCTALQALAVTVYTAPEGITMGEAVERYQRGELEESPIIGFS